MKGGGRGWRKKYYLLVYRPDNCDKPTLQQKSHLCIPRKEIARPQSQFPHSCVCVTVSHLYIPRISPHIFLQQNRQTDFGNIYIAHRHTNVEIGTETPIFLFWEYFLSNFRHFVFAVCLPPKSCGQGTPALGSPARTSRY